MGYVTYLAERELQVGVIGGQSVTLTLGFGRAQRGIEWVGSRAVSLNGWNESVTDRVDKIWRVATTYHLDSERDDIAQFLASVIGGQRFSIDFEGTVASPDVVRSVHLRDSRVVERRLATGVHRLQLTLVEV